MNQSIIKWRDIVDTADGRDEMIVANWQQFAAAAWDGYMREGRGALLLDLKSAPNSVTHPGINLQATYLALEALLAAGTESETGPDGLGGHLDRLRTYDPRREMVLFIASGDGDVLRTRCLHSESDELLNPPEAYRAEREASRNNPHLS